MFTNIQVSGSKLLKTEEHWWYAEDLYVSANKWHLTNSSFESDYYYDCSTRLYFEDLDNINLKSCCFIVNGQKISYSERITDYYNSGFYYYRVDKPETGEKYVCVDFVYPKISANSESDAFSSPKTADFV
ncbi:MAG: hypothetical protein HUJ62_10815, partial [Streptococcus gallolyticus]|nr:hypothetical protein [Streptococcus gallolyticus]